MSQPVISTTTDSATAPAAMAVDEAAPTVPSSTITANSRKTKRPRSMTYSEPPLAGVSAPSQSQLAGPVDNSPLFGSDDEEEEDAECAGLFGTSSPDNSGGDNQSRFITPATFVAANLWSPVDHGFNEKLLRIVAAFKGCSNHDVQQVISYMGRAGTYTDFGTCDREKVVSLAPLGIEDLMPMLRGIKSKKTVIISVYRLLEYLFQYHPTRTSIRVKPYDIVCGNVSFAEVLGDDFSVTDPRKGTWSSAKVRALSEALSLELGLDFSILTIPLREYRSMIVMTSTLKFNVENRCMYVSRADDGGRRKFLKDDKGNLLVSHDIITKCEACILKIHGNPVSNLIFAQMDKMGYLWKTLPRLAKMLPPPQPIPALMDLQSDERTRARIGRTLPSQTKTTLIRQRADKRARNRLMQFIPEMDYFIDIGVLPTKRRKQEFLNSFEFTAAVTSFSTDIPKAPQVSMGPKLFVDPGWTESVKESALASLSTMLKDRNYDTLVIYMPIIQDYKQSVAFLEKMWAYCAVRKYTSFAIFHAEQAHSAHYMLHFSRTPACAQKAGSSRDCYGRWAAITDDIAVFRLSMFMGMAGVLEVVMKAEINYMRWCRAGVPYPWLSVAPCAISPLFSQPEEESELDKMFTAAGY